MKEQTAYLLSQKSSQRKDCLQIVSAAFLVPFLSLGAVCCIPYHSLLSKHLCILYRAGDTEKNKCLIVIGGLRDFGNGIEVCFFFLF